MVTRILSATYQTMVDMGQCARVSVGVESDMLGFQRALLHVTNLG